MRKAILLIFMLFFLQNYALACIPANSIKYIVKHRLENFNDESDITNPVQIAKKEDLNDFFSHSEENDFRSQNRQAETTTEDPAEEKTSETTKKTTSTEKTTASSEKSTTASNDSTTTAPITTSTFKTGTLDDPNWIPGEFLDNYGNPKVIPPPPVTTILADFLALLEERNNLFLWTGANFLISFALLVIFLIELTTVLCIVLPLFKRMKEDVGEKKERYEKFQHKKKLQKRV